jgi:hypothetical protein
VVQAFRDLELGLIEDLALVIEAERDGRAPDWSIGKVLGDFPRRHYSYFDARFVRKLAAAGMALNRRLCAGWCAPESMAEFMLAVWALGRADLIARSDPGLDVRACSDLAADLGLTRAHDETGTASQDEWNAAQTLESIQLDPEDCFETVIRTFRRAASSGNFRTVLADGF